MGSKFDEDDLDVGDIKIAAMCVIAKRISDTCYEAPYGIDLDDPTLEAFWRWVYDAIPAEIAADTIITYYEEHIAGKDA